MNGLENVRLFETGHSAPCLAIHRHPATFQFGPGRSVDHDKLTSVEPLLDYIVCHFKLSIADFWPRMHAAHKRPMLGPEATGRRQPAG